MEDDAVAAKLSSLEEVIKEILVLMNQEVERLGYKPDEVVLKSFDAATYHLEKDPYSGEDSLVGHWFDNNRMKLGNLLFHADGSFFVEHDVMKLHPSKKQWLVEAVNAWGKDHEIKVEARLLEAL